MAKLKIEFIKLVKKEWCTYSDAEVVATDYVVGKRMRTEERKNGYEICYYCRKTKNQKEGWLIRQNNRWYLYGGNIERYPHFGRYDYTIVNEY